MRTFVTLTVMLFLGCSQQDSGPERKPLGVPLPSAAAAALHNGAEFQLFSLDPTFRNAGSKPDGFHGFTVLGATAVTSSEQKKLADALAAGIEGSFGAIAACFDPRHGIRVRHDGKLHDFVICFECLQIYWYIDDQKISTILTSESPLETFNKVLTYALIDLPDPA